MKKVIYSLIGFSIAISAFLVFVFPSTTYAQPPDDACAYNLKTPSEKAKCTEANSLIAQARANYDYIEGIGNRTGDEALVAKIAPFLAEAKIQRDHVIRNASKITNHTITISEADAEQFLVLARANLAALNQEMAKATAATGKPQEQIVAESMKRKDGVCYISFVPGGPDFDFGVCFRTLAAWIAYLALMMTSWLVGLAGLLFNLVLSYTVVEMKTRIDGISAINAGWKILRDVGNLAFIFILIYIAVKTILGLAGGDTKRMIRNIIIVALLVNFSLFFTKVLIDASNIISINFFQRIVGTNDFTSATAFSERFTTPLGLPSIYEPSKWVDSNVIGGSLMQIVITGFGGSIFLVITAFTFLYAAILFILRFVLLIILMMLSPIAFFGLILPGTKQYSSQWWNTLQSQLIFAPLYLILIYIVLVITHGIQSTLGNNILGSLIPSEEGGQISGGSSAMSGALNFLIIIILLNAATVIATKVAASAGGAVGNLVGGVRNFAGKAAGTATAGAAGFAARNTAGRIASKMANADSTTGNAMRRMALSQNVFSRVIGRNALKATKGVAEASYDVRNTKAAQSLAKTTGINIGAGAGKGGYEEKLKQQKAKTLAYVKNTELGGADKETMKKIKASRDAVRESQGKLEDARKGGDAGKIAMATTEYENKKGDLEKARKDKKAEVQKQRNELITRWGTKRSPSALWTKTARKHKEALAEYGVPPTDKKEAAEAEFNEKKDQLKALVEMREKAADADKTKIDESIYRLSKDVKHEFVGKLDPKVLKHDEFIKTLTVEKLKALSKSEEIDTEDYKHIAGRIIDPAMNVKKPKIPDTASTEEKEKLKKEIESKSWGVQDKVRQFVINSKEGTDWYLPKAADLKEKGKEGKRKGGQQRPRNSRSGSNNPDEYGLIPPTNSPNRTNTL